MSGGKAPALSISVSLAEIYNAVCPGCREQLLQLVTSKADGAALGELLRRQFEASGPSEPGEAPAVVD